LAFPAEKIKAAPLQQHKLAMENVFYLVQDFDDKIIKKTPSLSPQF